MSFNVGDRVTTVSGVYPGGHLGIITDKVNDAMLFFTPDTALPEFDGAWAVTDTEVEKLED